MDGGEEIRFEARGEVKTVGGGGAGQKILAHGTTTAGALFTFGADVDPVEPGRRASPNALFTAHGRIRLEPGSRFHHISGVGKTVDSGISFSFSADANVDPDADATASISASDPVPIRRCSNHSSMFPDDFHPQRTSTPMTPRTPSTSSKLRPTFATNETDIFIHNRLLTPPPTPRRPAILEHLIPRRRIDMNLYGSVDALNDCRAPPSDDHEHDSDDGAAESEVEVEMRQVQRSRSQRGRDMRRCLEELLGQDDEEESGNETDSVNRSRSERGREMRRGLEELLNQADESESETQELSSVRSAATSVSAAESDVDDTDLGDDDEDDEEDADTQNDLNVTFGGVSAFSISQEDLDLDSGSSSDSEVDMVEAYSPSSSCSWSSLVDGLGSELEDSTGLRASGSAAAFLGGALDWLLVDFLEAAGDAAKDEHSDTILPDDLRHVQASDQPYTQLLGNVSLPH